MDKRKLYTLIVVFLAVALILGYKFLDREIGYTGGLQPSEDPVIALQEAFEENSPIFLMFTGKSCPACVRAWPWIEELYQEYNGEITFVIADIEKGGRPLAMQVGIQSIPHFFYIDREGNLMDEFAGYPSNNGKEFLEERLQQLLQ